MMDERSGTTLLIWSAVVLITFIGGIADLDNAIMILAIIMGGLSTVAVWVNGAPKVQHEGTNEKAKREGDSRVQLLLQLLDEDEKRQIKQRLMNSSDGELSLEALLEMENRSQR